MSSRFLSITAAALLVFGMSAVAQDASSGSSQSGSTSSAKTKHSKKDMSGGATSSTQSGSADQSASNSGRMAAADKAFVMKAAEGGLAEVELGKLAADKASSNDVKQFGQMMVDDHSKANDQLKSVAQQKGITLPTDTDAKHKAEKDRLSK